MRAAAAPRAWPLGPQARAARVSRERMDWFRNDVRPSMPCLVALGPELIVPAHFQKAGPPTVVVGLCTFAPVGAMEIVVDKGDPHGRLWLDEK